MNDIKKTATLYQYISKPMYYRRGSYTVNYASPQSLYIYSHCLIPLDPWTYKLVKVD